MNTRQPTSADLAQAIAPYRPRILIVDDLVEEQRVGTFFVPTRSEADVSHRVGVPMTTPRGHIKRAHPTTKTSAGSVGSAYCAANGQVYIRSIVLLIWPNRCIRAKLTDMRSFCGL